MKKIIAALTLWLVAVTAFAQSDIKLNWKISVKKTDTASYLLTASTTIPAGWHLYGSNPAIDGLETVHFAFDAENIQTSNTIQFNKSASTIKDALFDNKQASIYIGNIELKQAIKISGFIPPQLKGIITASIAKDNEFLSPEHNFELALEGASASVSTTQRIKLSAVDINHPLTECGDKIKQNEGFWIIFFLGFFGGLIALLTPCVFPMIPVTVSFFTNKSTNRKHAIKNGILYGLFIFLIYVVASIPFHLIGNVQPEIFNNISTNPWLNIFFFIVFIIFAISFFGFFEIGLPNSIANKANAKGGINSVGGIFFMALTLVIVSFSCTGVILGTLLVGTANNGAWSLTSGMAGFGAALALPFALFAIFPNWLKSLPKSGGWLDTVKKVLAFVEVALAFKFLSNADTVMHWGILKREVFFAIWILVGAGLTLYLYGVIRLPHDYKGMKSSGGKKFLGVLALLFTVYLLPGVTNSEYANLKLISGFPPPLHYSIYGKQNVNGAGLGANVVNDYEKAIALAQKEHKPLLIDFTGWACVNCRKMEEQVWTNTEVYQYIRSNYILLSLYVDDKEKLPLQQRLTYKSAIGNKDIKTIGDKWATFQAENFIQVSQPLYVILNNKEQLINYPVGYTPDADKYLAWLKCGKENFDKK